jgi:mannose-6-phosphate isomerase
MPAPAPPLYPLAFAPILKELIWGGRRLGTLLHKPIGPAGKYAESWEVADHRSDVSVVANGPLAGTSLRDLVRDRGDELLGRGRSKDRPDQFPLLVKFLDANDVLSVQVHPDDALGKKLADDNGKTEAWVIVHAEPGSLIYAGLNRGVGRDEFAAALGTERVEPLLHTFEARAGDCILIPAGTVHAIGAGVVLAEVQQMSDATFRVHDWGRVGPDGKPRALHPAEALESTDFEAGPVDPLTPTPEPCDGGTRERLARCPYFALERLTLDGPSRVGRGDRFTVVVGLGGSAEIRGGGGGEAVPLEFGRTLLLPASAGPCEVLPRAGGAVLLTCVVP